MESSEHPQDFCRRLAAVANALEAGDTLRFLASRRTPLARTNETTGHLDVLLRLSCHGQGQGSGVLVFEWPTRASGHSVITVLERWKDRCAEHETYEEGNFAVEWRSVTLGDRGSTPGVHLKIRFPLCHVPPVMHELIDVVSRVGITRAANAVIRRKLEQLGREEEAMGKNGRSATEGPGGRSGADLARIDRIVRNAEYDAAVHPRVRVNEQVENSRGETYRMVVKRVHGEFRQVWIKIPTNGVHTPPRD